MRTRGAVRGGNCNSWAAFASCSTRFWKEIRAPACANESLAGVGGIDTACSPPERALDSCQQWQSSVDLRGRASRLSIGLQTPDSVLDRCTLHRKTTQGEEQQSEGGSLRSCTRELVGSIAASCRGPRPQPPSGLLHAYNGKYCRPCHSIPGNRISLTLLSGMIT